MVIFVSREPLFVQWILISSRWSRRFSLIVSSSSNPFVLVDSRAVKITEEQMLGQTMDQPTHTKGDNEKDCGLILITCLCLTSHYPQVRGFGHHLAHTSVHCPTSSAFCDSSNVCYFYYINIHWSIFLLLTLFW